jgi:hypothetical protein
MLWQERYGKGSWSVRYGSESLVGRDQYGLRENWFRHNMIDEAFMLYWSIYEFLDSSCVIDHIGVG